MLYVAWRIHIRLTVWKVYPLWQKSINPPPCVVLSSLYGGVNPSKINWFRGNVSPNFVLDTSRISVLLPTTSFSISNLFLIELIFKPDSGFYYVSHSTRHFSVSLQNYYHSVDLWQIFLTFQCIINGQRTYNLPQYQNLKLMKTTGYLSSRYKFFNSPGKVDSKLA